jgi:hypothetical protein
MTRLRYCQAGSQNGRSQQAQRSGMGKQAALTVNSTVHRRASYAGEKRILIRHPRG